MPTLPSLTTTYIRAFKLYGQSFLNTLPFVLGLMLSKWLLNWVLPPKDDVDILFFIRMICDITITALFFSFIITTVYNKHIKKLNIIHTLSNGVLRFGQLFCAYFLISLPVLLTLGLLEIGYRFWVPVVITQDVAQVLMWGSITFIGIALLITVALFVLCFCAGIFIAINKENAFQGIKHSWKLSQPFWVDTLLLILIFGIFNISFDIVFNQFNIPNAYLIATLFFSSLYPSLMVIHTEHIQKALA